MKNNRRTDMADNLDRAGRLQFLQIDDETRALLREFRGVLERHIDDVLEAFYGYLRQNAGMASMFKSDASMRHARDQQRNHWLSNVFSGDFNSEYFRQVVTIGRVHEQVGLEPRWYIGAYAFTINKLTQLVFAHYRKKPDRACAIIQAVNKAVYLDMDISISVYIETARKTASANTERTRVSVRERSPLHGGDCRRRRDGTSVHVSEHGRNSRADIQSVRGRGLGR